MTEDFYDLLDIPPDASQDEIKEAYREKVRVYHPDVNDDDRARAQFTAVKKAHEILGDPVERRAYDRMGHKDYVSKRTSGIPSPDVWRSDSDSGSSSSSTTSTTMSRSTSSTGAGSTSTSSSRSSRTSTSSSTGGSGSTSRSRSRSSTSGSGSRTDSSAGASSSSRSRSANRSTGTGTGTGTATATGSTSGASASASTASGATGATSSTGTTSASGGGTASARTGGSSGTASSTRTRNRSRSDDADSNAFVRWWRRQNFALPLIWLSVLVYAVGLGHFARENESALLALANDLTAVGADPAALWPTLLESRHGVEAPAAFVVQLELLEPPLAPLEWSAALAGIVVAAIAIVLIARLGWREDTWGTITIDETIFLALAVTVSATLFGGPLLAGAALMPFLFTVIVHRTRLGPGWKPSYLYVVPVLAPAVALGVGLAGYASLPGDLLAFVVLPFAGAFGLPLRATIRKHFNR